MSRLNLRIIKTLLALTGAFAFTGCSGVSSSSQAHNPGSNTAGALVLSPSSLSFGNVALGSSSSLTGTLSATNADVTVSSAAWSGSGYSVTGITFPAVVAPGKSTSYTVTFAPPTSGTSSGGISFVSDASDSSVIEPLTGVGTQIAPPLALVGTLPFNTGFNSQGRIPATSRTLDFGSCRIWGSTAAHGNLIWSLLDTSTGTSSGQTNYSNLSYLDSYLASVYTAAGSSIPCIMVLGQTPANASGSSDANCVDPTDYVAGSCHPPQDLNSDGTGANLWWRNWIAALATHFTASGYSSTHAVPLYFEIWNEVDKANPTITPTSNTCDGCFYIGTYDQLQRMAEDAHCILKGLGTDTIKSNANETCSHVWSTVNSVTVTGALYPTAEIVLPSSHAYDSTGVCITSIMLYNGTTSCTPKTGSSATKGGLAAVTDIVNTHVKTCEQVPCTVTSPNTMESQLISSINLLRGVLKSSELAKPIWIDEGGYSESGWPSSPAIYSDPQMEQAFILRNWLVGLSNGIGLIDNYLYDISNKLCPSCNGTFSSLPLAGWNTTYSWLSGMAFGSVIGGVPTPNSGCTVTNHLWWCVMTDNTNNYVIAWRDDQTCSGGTCNTVSLTLPSTCSSPTQWTDVNGNVTSGASTVLGAQPILIKSCM